MIIVLYRNRIVCRRLLPSVLLWPTYFQYATLNFRINIRLFSTSVCLMLWNRLFTFVSKLNSALCSTERFLYIANVYVRILRAMFNLILYQHRFFRDFSFRFTNATVQSFYSATHLWERESFLALTWILWRNGWFRKEMSSHWCLDDNVTLSMI